METINNKTLEKLKYELVRDGVVTYVSGDKVVVEGKQGKEEHVLTKFKRSNQGTCSNQRPIVKKGDKVEIGDVLFSYETDKASFECESTEEGTLLEIFFLKTRRA